MFGNPHCGPASTGENSPCTNKAGGRRERTTTTTHGCWTSSSSSWHLRRVGDGHGWEEEDHIAGRHGSLLGHRGCDGSKDLPVGSSAKDCNQVRRDDEAVGRWEEDEPCDCRSDDDDSAWESKERRHLVVVDPKRRRRKKRWEEEAETREEGDWLYVDDNLVGARHTR